MLRHLAIPLLLSAMAAAATAAPYKDPAGRFDMIVPSGWSIDKPEDDSSFEIKHEEAASAPYKAMCSGMYDEVAETRSLTQQELNESLAAEVNDSFWATFLNADSVLKKTVDTSGSRKKSGRDIHYLVFTAKPESAAPADGIKDRLELNIVPGSMHLVLCMSKVQHYTAATSDFDTLFTSYEPHAGAIVSSIEKRAPSVLTMFASANFKGTARVLATDTANLAAAGWPTLSASLAIDGREPWQVCTAADYAGQCRTLLAADAGTGRPMQIGSARRLAGHFSLKNLIATNARRALIRQLNKR